MSTHVLIKTQFHFVCVEMFQEKENFIDFYQKGSMKTKKGNITLNHARQVVAKF